MAFASNTENIYICYAHYRKGGHYWKNIGPDLYRI